MSKHKYLPRIMLAAPASGSGKTLLTCGILMALKNRGLHTASFKCGPDYIDPLFHREVIGIPARNLDTFFTDREMTKYLFGRTAIQAEISVLEGVMGYYDGAGGNTTLASSYELACVTDTPVILIVNAKGMSLSVVAVIQGFLDYRKENQIAGVILNQISPAIYEKLRQNISQELSLPVFGYVPQCPELVIESRHLGLVMPEEIADIDHRLQRLSKLLEETLDMDGIIACAKKAPALDWQKPESLKALEAAVKCNNLEYNDLEEQESQAAKCKNIEKQEIQEQAIKCKNIENLGSQAASRRIRIGVARDEAFCFLYEDNLELLTRFGAELLYFSPIHDKELPPKLEGLIFCGGYPELYAKELSENQALHREIREGIVQGIPYLAECGGFLYLQQSMEDMEGNIWPAVGVLSGEAYRTKRLGRFGYITLTANREGQLLKPGDSIKAHEYHYFECSENGRDYHATKPFATREWDCIQGGAKYAAGFPHLYYYSNPGFIVEFLQQCRNYGNEKNGL